MTSTTDMVVLVIDLPSAMAGEVSRRLVRLGVPGFQEEDRSGLDLRWIIYCETTEEAATLRDSLRSAVAAPDDETLALRIEARHVGDWRRAWAERLAPVQLTPTLVVDPNGTVPPGESVLRLVPAMAFGYGEHPSTRLAARALAAVCSGGPRRVLDVGTGSGILALAAVKLGARSAIGIDTSVEAVESAWRNARLNGLSGCTFSASPLGQVPGRFDVVVANIEASVLEALASELVRRVADGGVLIVAGFVEESVEPLRRCFSLLGFVPDATGSEADWMCLSLLRSRD